MTSGHVLSIQSHVVHGYVGNKAATFPLQLLGFDVDPLNTVHFSNHTGYPHFKGERLQGEQLWELFNGLLANGLTDYTHVLTGYIGSPSFLETTVKLIKELKRLNPELIYVCDPVMGDDGKLFVSAELVPLFCEKLVPLSDIVLPNHFEAELLSGVTIKTIEDVKVAIDKIHQKGVKRVVLTSVYLAGVTDSLFVVGSQQHPDGATTQFKIKIPELPMSFTGTGDLFSALLLARSQQHGDNLRFACEQVIGSMHKVLKRTLEASQAALGRVSKDDLETSSQRKACELRLIESKRDIEEPEVVLKSELI